MSDAHEKLTLKKMKKKLYTIRIYEHLVIAELSAAARLLSNCDATAQ